MERYASEPKSGKDIARFAMKVRGVLGLENVQWLDVVRFLEYMPFLFPGFCFKIAEEDELPPGVQADTDPVRRIVRVRRSVYNGAFDGNTRHRFTIAHELGHFFLMCEFGVRFSRADPDAKLPAYKDPEWQADCFAGEFLAPSCLIGGMTAEEVASTFGVSRAAAEIQLRKCQRRL